MYVVAGVSGNTGSVVAETLLAQGRKVRVLVRDAAKGEPWRARGAEVAVASVEDAEALGRAFAGAEGAYVLLPPRVTSTQVLADNARIADAIAVAADASGLRHVVALSSVGAQHAAGTGPIRGAHALEQRLAASKADTTFVRAAYFMENWGASLAGLAGAVFPTFVNADLAIPMVATKDIGRTAATALIEGPRGRRIIELSGPREYTPREVARALSALVGKELTVQQGPEEAIVPAFTSYGMSADMAELYRELIHGVNVGIVAMEGGAARQVRGATTIEEVLKGLLAKGA